GRGRGLAGLQPDPPARAGSGRAALALRQARARPSPARRLATPVWPFALGDLPPRLVVRTHRFSLRAIARRHWYAPAMRAGWHANRHSLGLGLVGIAASAVFLYLATRGLDPAKVEHAVRRAGLLELAAAASAMAGVYTCQAARW